MPTRQDDLINRDAISRTSVVVVGAGAIGSQVIRYLHHVEVPHLAVIDHDTVGPENFLTQGFHPQAVGLPKARVRIAECLTDREQVVAGVPDASYMAFNVPFQPSILNRRSLPHRHLIVFSCVDRMSARREIFNAINEPSVRAVTKYLIDVRMSGHLGRVLAVNAESQESRQDYAATLFEDSEGDQGRCTARGTLYSAGILGGLAVSQALAMLDRPLSRADSDVYVSIRGMEFTRERIPETAGAGVSA